MAEPTRADGAPRRRDPQRRLRILNAAAQLVAQHGYHEVGMADIGAAAGVTGSAIYRHFAGKSAVLVAMFDRVIDDLSTEAEQIVTTVSDPRTALRRLVRGQVMFAINDRTLAQVYHNEITNLPDPDRRRLRRKQRLYIEEWVHVLATLRPKMNDAELRARAHAAIGAIQSTLFYSSGLAEDRLVELMCECADAVLLTD
jgi:AcrR family transcriptional regulator